MGAGFREDGEIAKGTRNKENMKDDGSVNYFDCGDGFTAEYVYQNFYHTQ